jgi:hypothetical protein
VNGPVPQFALVLGRNLGDTLPQSRRAGPPPDHTRLRCPTHSTALRAGLSRFSKGGILKTWSAKKPPCGGLFLFVIELTNLPPLAPLLPVAPLAKNLP